MAAVQSAYTNRHSAYTLGQVLNQELSNTISRKLEDASAVGFGEAMFAGTDDDEVTATPSALFEGITVKDITVEGAVADTYEQGDAMSLLNHGVVVVQASKAVDKGDPVYVTSAGAFTDVSTDNTAIPEAVFDATTSGAGLCPIRVK